MDENPTPFEALMACCNKAGSQSQLARDLGCSQTAIWKMIQSAKRMSAEYVLRAEHLYGVSRHALRPDIYPRDYPLAPDDNRRWIGVDMAAPGYDRSEFLTIPAYGAR